MHNRSFLLICRAPCTFSFRMVYFLPRDYGLDSDISLREKSLIKQSITYVLVLPVYLILALIFIRTADKTGWVLVLQMVQIIPVMLSSSKGFPC